jgi:hypothetical protein
MAEDDRARPFLTDPELILGLSRHLGTYQVGAAHAALAQLEFAGRVYEMAWRLRGSGLSPIRRVAAIGLEAGIPSRQLIPLEHGIKQHGKAPTVRKAWDAFMKHRELRKRGLVDGFGRLKRRVELHPYIASEDRPRVGDPKGNQRVIVDFERQHHEGAYLGFAQTARLAGLALRVESRNGE